MILKLYQFPHSPFCIPISRILRSGGVEFEEVFVPNWDRGVVAELTGGEYYQVPVIENGGDVVFESSDTSLDVARYVDQLVGGGLFPDRIAGVHEAVIGHIESEIEGVGFKTMDPGYIAEIEGVRDRTAVVRHKERKFGRGCVTAWAARHTELLAAFYAEVDRFRGAVEHNRFLFGEDPVYADYALYGVIGNVHYRPENVRMEGREWLADWIARLEAHRLGGG